MDSHMRGDENAKASPERQSRARECVVFFRDDDVDELTDELTGFVNLFLTARIPVNYQIVPGKLSDDACEFILAKRRQYPELIRLNQHGYMHEHVVNGMHTWFEYSGNRPYEDQYQSIQCGQRILSEKLGPYFDNRVFTPPGHKLDNNTLRALENLEFQIISASSYTSLQARLYYKVGRLLRRTNLLGKRVSYNGRWLPRHRLREVSVALDVDMAKDSKGNPIVKTSSRLIREFRQARRKTKFVGIVLHHGCYDRRRQETLRDFLGFLKSTPGVSFRFIEDVAKDLDAF
jgi:hypothetical protein